MISYLIEYVGKNGKTIVKGVSSEEEMRKTVEWLDRRIEKGTCNGYLVTSMNEEHLK